MGLNQQMIDLSDSDKVTWLADQICTSFPKEVTGLKLYIIGCGCIYYQRVFRNGVTPKWVSIGTLKMGLVMFVWAWMGAGKNGWLMRSLFIMVSSR